NRIHGGIERHLYIADQNVRSCSPGGADVNPGVCPGLEAPTLELVPTKCKAERRLFGLPPESARERQADRDCFSNSDDSQNGIEHGAGLYVCFPAVVLQMSQKIESPVWIEQLEIKLLP